MRWCWCVLLATAWVWLATTAGQAQYDPLRETQDLRGYWSVQGSYSAEGVRSFDSLGEVQYFKFETFTASIAASQRLHERWALNLSLPYSWERTNPLDSSGRPREEHNHGLLEIGLARRLQERPVRIDGQLGAELPLNGGNPKYTTGMAITGIRDPLVVRGAIDLRPQRSAPTPISFSGSVTFVVNDIYSLDTSLEYGLDGSHPPAVSWGLGVAIFADSDSFWQIRSTVAVSSEPVPTVHLARTTVW